MFSGLSFDAHNNHKTYAKMLLVYNTSLVDVI